jgi:diguanylate cyclase (GGDEF)-like protein
MKAVRVTHSSLEGGGLLASLEKTSAPLFCITLALILAATFLLDASTSSAPVQHLYYIPLVFAALRFGRNTGLEVSVLAIVLYHVANPRLLTLGHNEGDILQICVFVCVPAFSAKLASDARRLRSLALTDDLTGLSNLRGFETALERLADAAGQAGKPLSMLVLDLDHLKRLNDSYGHRAGSDAVRITGRSIDALAPQSTAACRYGGDEFAIVSICTSEEAWDFAERLRREMHSLSPLLAGRRMPAGTISISIGIATRTCTCAMGERSTSAELGESLFHAADAALYLAKAGGRNRVSAQSPVMADCRAELD